MSTLYKSKVLAFSACIYLIVAQPVATNGAQNSAGNSAQMPASLATAIPSGSQEKETTANTIAIPHQILRSGININSVQLSANSVQLAGSIKLTPILQRIETLRSRVSLDEVPTNENTSNYVALLAAQEQAQRTLLSTDLSIDYVLAEINAEQQLYSEILSTLQAKAGKKVQYSNWASYYSNGALWAISESLTIPTWKRPKYSISSGTVGIIAGIIPSIFSVYGMHAASGSKYAGEADANMLAKILDAPINTEVDYPESVWEFLNSVPPGDKVGKTRRAQLVDRWIADSNLPSFTNRDSRLQVEALAGVSDRKNTVTISLLQTRVDMLSQLASEIQKMKRFLYELSLVVNGDKRY